MGLLIGGAKALFGELLHGAYAAATLHGATITTYDAGGKLRRTRSETPCRVQVESATERMRNADGFTGLDRALYILAHGLEGGVDTDAEITVHEGEHAGTRFRVASVECDPAGAYYLCRGVARRGVD